MSAEAAKDKFDPFAAAQALVTARKNGVSLGSYPGPLPGNLIQAYDCQEAAIELWRDEIAGWKIGLIPPSAESHFGERRLAGPIYRQSLRQFLSSPVTPFPVFAGGFAAVEAEFVFELLEDTPPGKVSWSREDAMSVATNLRTGVEIAGSPLATINDLGPTAVVSDFGNNAGLILGAPIEGWQRRDPASLVCGTFIGDAPVGQGNAKSLPGGLVEALRWILEHCARRSRPLRTGQYVSSGAITGVHEIKEGEIALVDFGVFGAIRCQAFATAPRQPGLDHRSMHS